VQEVRTINYGCKFVRPDAAAADDDDLRNRNV
jgi:hypothetical protein